MSDVCPVLRASIRDLRADELCGRGIVDRSEMRQVKMFRLLVAEKSALLREVTALNFCKWQPSQKTVSDNFPFDGRENLSWLFRSILFL